MTGSKPDSIFTAMMAMFEESSFNQLVKINLMRNERAKGYLTYKVGRDLNALVPSASSFLLVFLTLFSSYFEHCTQCRVGIY